MSESVDELLKIMPDNKNYRIEDTRMAGEASRIADALNRRKE